MEMDSDRGKAKVEIDLQGYGLRSKPKKSWKSLCSVDDGGSPSSMVKLFQCKACGKEFESMRALFGHMRHHSRKERKRVNCQECGKKFQSLRALTGHMKLHGRGRKHLALESLTVRKKRSKRMRYGHAPNSSLSSLNESSAAGGSFETDQDLEDVALCLIMLSRGVRNWSDLNCLKCCPDNSEIMLNENGNLLLDGGDVSASVNVLYEEKTGECKELNSGVVTDKEMKVGSEESPTDMLCTDVEFRVSKVDDESGFEFYDTEVEERISGEVLHFIPVEVVTGKDLKEGLDLAGFGSTKSVSCQDAMLDACDARPGGNSMNKLICTQLCSEMYGSCQRNDKYKCKICNKTFKSHQALGGHQTFHRKSNGSSVEQIENCGTSFTETEASDKFVQIGDVENSVEQEIYVGTSCGTREYKAAHECQICFKVFASGQALGGHKRSHMFKEIETGEKQPEMQLEIPDHVIDLNLSSLHNEEANDDVGFKSCRVGSDCKSELIVSLVAN